jgi:hypothetical protein
MSQTRLCDAPAPFFRAGADKSGRFLHVTGAVPLQPQDSSKPVVIERGPISPLRQRMSKQGTCGNAGETRA